MVGLLFTDGMKLEYGDMAFKVKKIALTILITLTFLSTSYAIEWNHTVLYNDNGNVVVQFSRKKTNEEVVVPFLYLGNIHKDNRNSILNNYAVKLENMYQKIKTEKFFLENVVP